jgi:hypothetical protein
MLVGADRAKADVHGGFEIEKVKNAELYLKHCLTPDPWQTVNLFRR